MSQVGNAMKMLVILKSRGKLKIRELAEILEVDERTVRRYKDDLMQAGVYISSSGGKYGGYYLEGDDYLHGLSITNEEYASLQTAQRQLCDTNHPVSKDYEMFLEKINLVYKKPSHVTAYSDNYMVKNARGNFDFKEERKKLIDIRAAMITRNKIKIKYTSIKSGFKERIVHPYAIFQYKGDIYFAAFCEYRNTVIDFKLCRISFLEVLSQSFQVQKDFNLQLFMKNCIGIYKDKEYNVRLKIRFPMSQIVKEKIWVDNQKIIECAEGAIVYEAKMRGLAEIKSWILGMGSSADVIGPEELKKEIADEIFEMKKIYTKNNS